MLIYVIYLFNLSLYIFIGSYSVEEFKNLKIRFGYYCQDLFYRKFFQDIQSCN